MAQPTQLTPTEQDALVKQIGLAMLRVAPDDWEQLTVDYRAVGRYAESTGQVTYSDGSAESWEMPADLRGLFARLRGGMYREGRGTWFNARYKLDHPSSYNLEYDRDEPTWDMPPPPQAYPDDMGLFPRTDENVPEWLRRRLATVPPPGGPRPGPGPDRPLGPQTPRFRVARIFDGPGEDGRPSVNRPPVDEMDITELLDYLDGAPLVGPARGYDVDRLDPNGQQSVPIAFHTDGTWIWPAAVNYFLREHDIAPEPDLVEHIRRMRFKLVPVDEQTRSAAQLFLGPPPGAPRPGPPAPGGPPAPAPTRALPVPPPPAPVPAPAAPPRAALPSQGPPAQQIDHLRARLEDLDVPETAYRIGPPTGRGWAMEQTDEGWRVGWHDHDWVAPAMFEDVADASAFLLGKLMLDTDRWAAGPKNPELTPAPVPTPGLGGPPPAPPSPGPSLAPEDRGFEPMSAPIEAFEPMSAPIEAFEPMSAPIDDYAPPGRSSSAGPVGPPPGTPGYATPPPGTPGFTDPPGRPDFADSPGRFSEPGYADAPGRSGLPSRQGFSEPSDTPAYSDSSSFSDSSGFSEPSGYDSSGRQGFSEPSSFADSPGRFSEPPEYSDSSSRQGYSESPSFEEAPGRFTEPAGTANSRGSSETPGYADSPSGHGFSEPSNFADSPGLFSESSDKQGFSDAPSYSDSPGFSEPSDTPSFTRPGPPPGTPPRPKPAPTMAMEQPSRGDQATVLASRPTNGAAAAPAGAEWPITPLPGEPPLTLFRGKRVIELEPGTEIDRFGEDDGNLVYAAGTPFSERSLVPEWVDRPYHVYRVRQGFQALTGAAIPWFDQPGGGTAFLLPDAIGELVARGHLAEVDGRDRPPA